MLLFFASAVTPGKLQLTIRPPIQRWLIQNCKLPRFQGKLCDKILCSRGSKITLADVFSNCRICFCAEGLVAQFQKLLMILKDSKQFTILEGFHFCMKLGGQHLGFRVFKELPKFPKNSSQRHCCFNGPLFHAHLRSVALTDNFDIGRIRDHLLLRRWRRVVLSEWPCMQGACKAIRKLEVGETLQSLEDLRVLWSYLYKFIQSSFSW